jgi:hypothetical protein
VFSTDRQINESEESGAPLFGLAKQLAMIRRAAFGPELDSSIV